MSWLLLSKVFPVFDVTPAPAPGFAAKSTRFVEETCWDIRCQDESLGFASNRIEGDASGNVSIVSTLQLDEIPVGQIISELQASWTFARAFGAAIPAEATLSLATDTQMEFMGGRLERFESIVDLDHLGPMFHVQGARVGDQLQIEVLPGRVLEAEQTKGPLFSTQVKLPDDVLVVDSFSPYSELDHLRVGKRWQMRSYRAFPPSRPLRVVDARVVRTEMLLWEGEIITCFVVSLTDAGNDGPTAAAAPTGWMWVSDDGQVLKQRIELAGVTLEFLRRPDRFCGGKRAEGASG